MHWNDPRYLEIMNAKGACARVEQHWASSPLYRPGTFVFCPFDIASYMARTVGSGSGIGPAKVMHGLWTSCFFFLGNFGPRVAGPGDRSIMQIEPSKKKIEPSSSCQQRRENSPNKNIKDEKILGRI